MTMTPITRESAQARAEVTAPAIDLFAYSHFDEALEQFSHALQRDLLRLERRYASFSTTSSLRQAAKSWR